MNLRRSLLLVVVVISCGPQNNRPAPATPEQMSQLVTFERYEDLLKAMLTAYVNEEADAVRSMVAQQHHASAMCPEFVIAKALQQDNDIDEQIAFCKARFLDGPAALAAVDTNEFGAGYEPELAPSFQHWNEVCPDLNIHSPTPYRFNESAQPLSPVMELSYLYVYKGRWGALTVPVCQE